MFNQNISIDSVSRSRKSCIQGVNPGRLGVAIPRFWAGVVGGRRTGREILLYLIIYRKDVRKWRLLKRNRIICLEVAVNERYFCLENRISFKIARKKLKLFKTLPGKIEIC